MANTTVTVNGTPVVFNNILLSVDGATNIEINDYIMSINWTTGTQTDHVATLTQDGFPITTNSVVSSPSGSVSFAPGAFDSFYQFLNDRYSKFTIQLIQYVTGNLGGAQQSILIENAQIDTVGGGSQASRPANDSSFSFKATYAGYLKA